MTTEEKRYGEYEGGCHCGYVRFSMRLSPPLQEYRVVNCNCSVCRRMGYLLIYPLYEDVTWHHGSKERCSVYQFSTKTMDHLFCPKCGASIGIDFRNGEPRKYGFSARAIDGVDLDKLDYIKYDGVNIAGPAGDLSVRDKAEGTSTDS